MISKKESVASVLRFVPSLNRVRVGSAPIVVHLRELWGDLMECLDCGDQARPFEILEVYPSGKQKVRFLCACGIAMDVVI